MNNGKICISICPKTAEELFEHIRRAEQLADVIEVRFDCLSGNDFKTVFGGLKSTKPILFTFRPESQGGQTSDDMNQRLFFWMSMFSECEIEKDLMWLDNEIDLKAALSWPEGYTAIRSFHDFSGVPENLTTIYEELASYDQVVKIAVLISDITDAIQIWKLLERAKSEGKRIIPIAMGEAGKWTRILGLANGAFLTYTSLDAGAETAPGQITAADMTNVFRARELDEKTEVYGIVAGDTSYSVSPWMHNTAFKGAGMNRVFVPLQVADLDEFMRRMVKHETREIDINFSGFSVTNPHKQAIMRHLDEIDETAVKIGAVNTVKIVDRKMLGFNTDAPGFIAPLKASFGDLNGIDVGVAGAGGAARACIYALAQEGAKVSVFARDRKNAKAIADEFGVNVGELYVDADKLGIDIIVNATPLGTKGGEEEETIATAKNLRGVKLVYDLVYNPCETRLIREAKKANVPTIGGLEMLIAQGAKQFEIWTGESAPKEAMVSAVKKKLGM
ncbi:MAG: shikimate dehydrogenase [Blastocatellia bacterium]